LWLPPDPPERGSRQDSESFGEVPEIGPRPQAGELEQVSRDEPGSVMGVGEFGCELFGLLQVVDGFMADLKARLGHDSARAAMIYQHATAAADSAIADGPRPPDRGVRPRLMAH
jgi:hypothetical protein